MFNRVFFLNLRDFASPILIMMHVCIMLYTYILDAPAYTHVVSSSSSHVGLTIILL